MANLPKPIYPDPRINGVRHLVDVFISYSRRDKEKVGMLARMVADEGYEVWWDEELPPHRSYGDVITEKIAGAKAAVVVWSADSAQSEWVRAEADMARNQRKLIQTSLDDVMPPLPFNQIQYADLGDWQGEPDHSGWRKVKVSLQELCGDKSAGAAAAGAAALPRPEPPVAAASAAAKGSNMPLFAGIGVAVLGIAAAGIMLMNRAGGAEAPIAASQVPVAEAAAPAVSGAGRLAAAETGALPERLSATGPEEPVAGLDGMTFPDSSNRLLSPSELAGLGPSTLRVARNEIFARKGRRFRDAWLRDYFSQYSWYRPLHDDVPLNRIEQQNVALISEAEAKYRGW
jgi:hypothetical protein